MATLQASDGSGAKLIYTGKLVFSQITEHLPMHTFRRCVRRYSGHHKVHSFTCLDQYLCMAFAQLTYRESLRDIEACLRSQPHKLYHMGLRGTVSRNTLANATRDWHIYADFAQRLITTARQLYGDEPLAAELQNTVYALDATTIDLCLSLFPWAHFVPTKGAVRLHTLLDLRGNIPSFIHITDGRVHDVRVLDELAPDPGALYVMDRGYLDFTRLYRLHQARAVCRSRPLQSPLQSALLPQPNRSCPRDHLRPNHRPSRGTYTALLSRADAPDQGPRSRAR